MKTLKSTFSKLMIVVSACVACMAFMFIHSCHAQDSLSGDFGALDYGSYGSQMNRQQLNRLGNYQGNLHMGSLKIHPSFHERLQHEDNIYKVSGTDRKMEGKDSIFYNTTRHSESKKSDLINIASPGLRLTLPIGDRTLYGKIKQFDLNWQSDFKNYRDNAGLNQDNHYVVGSVTFEVKKGYDLTLKNNWTHTDEGAGSETDSLHGRDTNTFGIALRMSQIIRSLRKLDIEFAFENFDQDYTQYGLERANRNQNSYSMNIYYNLTPKITITFPQYTYSVIRYDKARQENLWSGSDPLSDSYTNSLSGGVSWRATAKTTGYFNIGYTDRQYTKNSHQGWDLDTDAEWKTSDVSSYTMDGGVTTHLPWNTILDVNVFRVLREAEFTAKSNSYFSTGGSITLTNNFHKLHTDFNAGFFQTDFNGVNREDNIYTLAANASYAVTKWSTIEAGYSFKKKETNKDFDREDEEINKVYIGFGLGL